jgi:hypothetical protein
MQFSLKSCPEIATDKMNCDHTSSLAFYESQKYTLNFNNVLQEAAAKLTDVW